MVPRTHGHRSLEAADGKWAPAPPNHLRQFPCCPWDFPLLPGATPDPPPVTYWPPQLPHADIGMEAPRVSSRCLRPFQGAARGQPGGQPQEEQPGKPSCTSAQLPVMAPETRPLPGLPLNILSSFYVVYLSNSFKLFCVGRALVQAGLKS